MLCKTVSLEIIHSFSYKEIPHLSSSTKVLIPLLWVLIPEPLGRYFSFAFWAPLAVGLLGFSFPGIWLALGRGRCRNPCGCDPEAMQPCPALALPEQKGDFSTSQPGLCLFTQFTKKFHLWLPWVFLTFCQLFYFVAAHLSHGTLSNSLSASKAYNFLCLLPSVILGSSSSAEFQGVSEPWACAVWAQSRIHQTKHNSGLL